MFFFYELFHEIDEMPFESVFVLSINFVDMSAIQQQLKEARL